MFTFLTNLGVFERFTFNHHASPIIPASTIEIALMHKTMCNTNYSLYEKKKILNRGNLILLVCPRADTATTTM